MWPCILCFLSRFNNGRKGLTLYLILKYRIVSSQCMPNLMVSSQGSTEVFHWKANCEINLQMKCWVVMLNQRPHFTAPTLSVPTFAFFTCKWQKLRKEAFCHQIPLGKSPLSPFPHCLFWIFEAPHIISLFFGVCQSVFLVWSLLIMLLNGHHFVQWAAASSPAICLEFAKSCCGILHRMQVASRLPGWFTVMLAGVALFSLLPT